MNNLLGLHGFYELSSLGSIVAIGMRNQIHLRFALLFAFAFKIIDDYIIPGGPLWEHIVWNMLFFAFNCYVISELVFDRTTFGLSVDEKQLFSLFVALSPGEFRKLIRGATWKAAEDDLLIAAEGADLDRLCYVYEGCITVTKAARQMTVERPAFIGEIAFLRGTPATASVSLSLGSKWVEWSVPGLRRQLARDIALRSGFIRLLGEDLADKLART